ncbi:plasminogen-like [Ruditapes philippinarum]|uniref:plasminogen-like n=1 Tax=Ruditapes philippinarum TaxID=129788 RepID=UPI00295AAD7D|nr:plasminogen-like [Ruditapes philippinarum]
MTLRMKQIYTMIAAYVITSINGEECIDAPSYSGTLNVTLGGYTCQRWDSQQPHEHARNIPGDFPNDASVKDAHNYCRDADGTYELWCYTTDPKKRWDSCFNESDICSLSTGSPGQNEASTACCQSTLSLLKSTLKDHTSNSGKREGSTLAANTSAEIATPSSSGKGWICSFYLFPFALLMALLSCSYMYQNNL